MLTSPYARQPRRSTPSSPSASMRTPRTGAAARTRGWCGGSTSWPPRSAPSWSCSTRPCRSGSIGPSLQAALRRRAARRRGHRARPAARLAPGAEPRARRAPRTIIAAGGYPAAEAERSVGGGLPITVVPPGVDIDRFHPLTTPSGVRRARRLGLPVDADIVLGLSRLVPRKGFDVTIRAVARLAAHRPRPRAGRSPVGGRDRRAPGAAGERARRARSGSSAGSRTTTCPRLYGCADVFAMLCRSRWGGLEQEGFGIVFAEAAACGVPQVAGDSGGAAEAVADGRHRHRRARPGGRRRGGCRARGACSTTPSRVARWAAPRDAGRSSEFSYDLLAQPAWADRSSAPARDDRSVAC